MRTTCGVHLLFLSFMAVCFLTGDNISIYGADDVIDRFMSKQGHHR